MSIASPSRAVSLGPGANIINSRPFLKLCAWGVGAALALVAAVAAGNTELGALRARAAMTAVLSPPAGPDRKTSEQISALSGEFDRQMRRHAEMIRILAEQRDDLTGKVGMLERQINELGGTLARTTAHLEGETRSAQQAAAAAAAIAASARAVPARPDPMESSAPAMAAAHAPAPSPPASPFGRTPQPAPQAANPLPPGQIHPAATAAAGFPTLSGGPPPAQAYTGAIPMPAAPDADVPPGLIRPAPPPPPSAAAPDPWPAPLARPPAAKAPPPAAATGLPMFRSNPLMTTGIFETPAEPGAGFAIDLGAAPTVEVLRTRWNDLRISQAPLLDNLKPLVALKDGAKTGQELHLIAGPLTSNSAALRLCAVLVATALCQPALYEGQRLAAR